MTFSLSSSFFFCLLPNSSLGSTVLTILPSDFFGKGETETARSVTFTNIDLNSDLKYQWLFQSRGTQSTPRIVQSQIRQVLHFRFRRFTYNVRNHHRSGKTWSLPSIVRSIWPWSTKSLNEFRSGNLGMVHTKDCEYKTCLIKETLNFGTGLIWLQISILLLGIYILVPPGRLLVKYKPCFDMQK